MRILMFLASYFPPDRRVEREIMALAEAGHDVTLLCRQASGQPALDTYCGIARVVRVNSPFYYGYSLWAFSAHFVHPMWRRALRRWATEYRAQMFHAHDLGYASAALLAARQLGIPCVLDLHEHTIGQIQQILYANWTTRFNPLLRWVYSSRRWAAFQRACIHQAAAVITVSDELAQLLANEADVSRETIRVVMNVESYDEFSRFPLSDDLRERYAGAFVVSYIGGGGPHRGIDTAIHAAVRLHSRIPRFRLLIVGVDDDDTVYLRRLADRLGLNHCIEFVSHVSFERVASYFALSHVGLIPHKHGPQTDVAIPNKLFQYWICGVPVVVGSTPPLKRLIQETQGGLVFESENAESLADAVMRLAGAADLRATLGENGRRAAQGQYNWDIQKKKLLAIYDHLQPQSPYAHYENLHGLSEQRFSP